MGGSPGAWAEAGCQDPGCPGMFFIELRRLMQALVMACVGLRGWVKILRQDTGCPEVFFSGIPC